MTKQLKSIYNLGSNSKNRNIKILNIIEFYNEKIKIITKI